MARAMIEIGVVVFNDELLIYVSLDQHIPCI